MPSLNLPKITIGQLTQADEILALTTLPYYQVSGVLAAGQGVVTFGSLVAWDSSAKKFVKYNPGATTVTNENVGSGTGTKLDFRTTYRPVRPDSQVIRVAGATKTEGVDYWFDDFTGWIHFFTAPANGDAVTASYIYYTNWSQVAVGFVRIPADATSSDAVIEVVVGGAVKYSKVSSVAGWDPKAIIDLDARIVSALDALIF